jgi:hypothetical protein
LKIDEVHFLIFFYFLWDAGIQARRRLSLKLQRNGPMIWARRPLKITSRK